MKDTGILLPRDRCHCIHLLHRHSSGFTQFICLQDPLGSRQNIVPFYLFLNLRVALPPLSSNYWPWLLRLAHTLISLLCHKVLCHLCPGAIAVPHPAPQNRALGLAALDAEGAVLARCRRRQQSRSDTAYPAGRSSPAAEHKPRSHRTCPVRLLQCAAVKHKGIDCSCFSV